MANLSNINNILRTNSTGVGIFDDAVSYPLEISSATTAGMRLINTAGATYDVYGNTSEEFLITKVGVGERLKIASGGDATFAGTVDAQGFRTTSGSTDYSLLTRNSANTAVYIQQAGSGNIVDFRYGSQAAGQGTSAMYINASGDATFAGDVNITQATDVGVLNVANLDSGAAVGLSLTYPTTNVAAGDGLAIAIGVAGRGRSYIANSNVTTNLDASNLVFYTEDGGVIGERMIIDSSGNVGIGNASPSDFNSLGGLQVVIGDGTGTTNLTLYSVEPGGYGHVAFADSNVSSSSAQYAGLIQYYHANNDMRFYTNAAEKMRILASYDTNLGSTQPPASRYAGFASHWIGGHGWIGGNSTGGTSKNLVLSQNAHLNSAATWVATNTDSANYMEMWGGNFNFQVAGSTTAGVTPTWIQSVYMKNDGNVGIGTTSPDELLHLYKASGNTGLEIEAVSGGDPIIRFVSANNRTGDIFYTDATTLAKFSYDHSAQAFKTYAHNNTTVDFYLSETEAYFPSQDVGIGTTSPDSVLEVVAPTTKTNLGTVSNQTITLSGGGGVGEYNQIGFGYTAGDYSPGVIGYVTTNGAVSTLGALIFALRDSTTAIAPTERMRIDAGGYVGIGTSSPGSALDIANTSGNTKLTIQAGTASSVTGGSSIDIISRNSGSGTSPISRIEGIFEDSNDSALALSTTLGGSLTERMRIDSAGNVGIGNTSPQTKLQTNLIITGSYLAYLNGTSATFDASANIAAVHNSPSIGSATAAGLVLANNDKSDGAPSPIIAFSAKSASNTYNHTYAAIYGIRTASGADTNWTKGDIVFATGSGTGPNERMRITSGGDVLIGATAVYSGHSIVKSVSSGTALLVSNSNTGVVDNTVMQLNNAQTSSTTQGYFLMCRQGDPSTGTNRMIIYNNGDVKNVNNVYGAISDRKLKENIIDATPKLDDLCKVKIRSYNLKESGEKQIGVIAQELEEIFPSLVTESKTPEKDETTKSVKYSVFVPMLIKAIQELKAEIDILKNK